MSWGSSPGYELAGIVTTVQGCDAILTSIPLKVDDASFERAGAAKFGIRPSQPYRVCQELAKATVGHRPDSGASLSFVVAIDRRVSAERASSEVPAEAAPAAARVLQPADAEASRRLGRVR